MSAAEFVQEALGVTQLPPSIYRIEDEADENAPLLGDEKKTVELVALSAIKIAQNQTITTTFPDSLNPELAAGKFADITAKAAEIRKKMEVEAWKKDNKPRPHEGVVALVGADGFQMGFSGIQTVVAITSIPVPALANPSLTSNVRLQNAAKGLQTAVGALEIGSGIALGATGVIEIMSALDDLKASKNSTVDPKLKDLEVFQVSKTFQKIRLAMGILDFICGILICCIGILTIASIFCPFMPYWAISLMLIGVLLVPSIAPLIELSLKVYAWHQKTDVGHQVGMQQLLNAINNFNGTGEQKLLLSKRLAISMFVMLGFDKDAANKRVLDQIWESNDLNQIRTLYNQVMGQFDEKQMCQITSKALEYLKSRVGEEAACQLIESFKAMHQLFNTVTDSRIAPEGNNNNIQVLKQQIGRIQHFIAKWGKAIHIRLAVQILYVVSFFVSILCTLGSIQIGYFSFTWLQAAAPYLSAMQSALIFAAGAIPLYMDLMWRWLRGATLVVADSVKMDMDVVRTDMILAENREILQLLDEVKLPVNPENTAIQYKLCEIKDKIITIKDNLIQLEWLAEVEKDEVKKRELLMIINERYLLRLYALRIEQLTLLQQIFVSSEPVILSEKQRLEINQTAGLVTESIERLKKAQQDKIAELSVQSEFETEQGPVMATKYLLERRKVHQIVQSWNEGKISPSPLLTSSLELFNSQGMVSLGYEQLMVQQQN